MDAGATAFDVIYRDVINLQLQNSVVHEFLIMVAVKLLCASLYKIVKLLSAEICSCLAGHKTFFYLCYPYMGSKVAWLFYMKNILQNVD